jgi:hypothetical protein
MTRPKMASPLAEEPGQLGLGQPASDLAKALVDEVLAGARAVTLEVLGDSAAAAALVEQRLRAGSR